MFIFRAPTRRSARIANIHDHGHLIEANNSFKEESLSDPVIVKKVFLEGKYLYLK